MINQVGFGKFLDIAKREMSVLKYRQEIIANNIANADTPNYKRSSLNFETHLKEALDSENNPIFKAAKTNSAHIDFDKRIDYRSVTPRRFLDWQTQTDNNGNNVSIEQEKANEIKTTMAYSLITKSVNDYYKRISSVLR